MDTRVPALLFESSRTALLGALAASLVAACSGGGGGTGGTGTTISPTVSTGVMTKGSTIVNGVRFEDTAANITIDDTPKTATALQNGMVVKLVGSVNDDSITGKADRIKALIEARGTPSSTNAGANPQSLLLHGQTVLVDDQTVFSNPGGFAAINTGTQIEVHGLRDAAGNIRATRIEDNAAQMGDNTLDEIRGVVTGGAAGPNPATFNIGGQLINAGNATIVPTGATYQNGSVVEVYCAQPCTGAFLAMRLKVEDAQDDAFKPAAGQKTEAEGLISGFTAGTQNFSIGSTPVTISGSTRFEGGIATDLANNVKVEAEGAWNGTRLVASKIEFKRSVIRVQGNVVAVNGAQFTINVGGATRQVIIEKDDLTSGSVPANGTACVQVRGQRKGSATPLVVTAGEIGGCSNGNTPVLQAPVEAESGSNLTLLGFTVDVSTASDNPPFENIDTSPMTLGAFLNAVTPATTNAAGVRVPGTLVKVIFDSATPFAVRQAELED